MIDLFEKIIKLSKENDIIIVVSNANKPIETIPYCCRNTISVDSKGNVF